MNLNVKLMDCQFNHSYFGVIQSLTIRKMFNMIKQLNRCRVPTFALSQSICFLVSDLINIHIVF